MREVGCGLVKCAEKQIDISDWESVPLLDGPNVLRKMFADPESGITERDLVNNGLKRVLPGIVIGGAGGAGLGALIGGRHKRGDGALMGGLGGAFIGGLGGVIAAERANNKLLRSHGYDRSFNVHYKRDMVSPEVKKKYGKGINFGGSSL